MTDPIPLAERVRDKWVYLETEPALNAPITDNSSGLYCPACRQSGLAHCSEPEFCGGMRRMNATLHEAADALEKARKDQP
jgi:hypothetical protein